MTTLDTQPVAVELVDCDNMATVRLADGRRRVVSAFRLKGTEAGSREVGLAVQQARRRTRLLEQEMERVGKPLPVRFDNGDGGAVGMKEGRP